MKLYIQRSNRYMVAGGRIELPSRAWKARDLTTYPTGHIVICCLRYIKNTSTKKWNLPNNWIILYIRLLGLCIILTAISE